MMSADPVGARQPLSYKDRQRVPPGFVARSPRTLRAVPPGSATGPPVVVPRSGVGSSTRRQVRRPASACRVGRACRGTSPRRSPVATRCTFARSTPRSPFRRTPCDTGWCAARKRPGRRPVPRLIPAAGDHPRRERRRLGEDLAATCVDVQGGVDLDEPIGKELRMAPRWSLLGCSGVEPVESPTGHIGRNGLATDSSSDRTPTSS